MSCAALALAGCATATPVPTAVPPTGLASAQAAEQGAADLLALRRPGSNPVPAATCVVDNATAAETASLASVGAGDIAPATATLNTILARDVTRQCLASSGVPEFG
jgi:hypothetical protein